METADLVLIVAMTMEFVVGIALNLQILLVYIGNLKNGLSLGPSDRVHLTKALVNVSMHCIMAAQNIINNLWPHLLSTNEVFLWNAMINMSLISYSYWLMAVLCVYYCTNVTNCGHRCFVWLKRSLSFYLLHILLVSGLGSVIINCPIVWFGNMNLPVNSTYQSSFLRATFFQNLAYRTEYAILGSFLPFTIAFVSTIITSWSLINHIWRMKKNNQGLTSSKLQPQINATRTMMLFLLISVVYSIAQMFFFTITSRTSQAVVRVIWFALISYPKSEAILIIQSSSKLRTALLGKFFSRKRRNNEAET